MPEALLACAGAVAGFETAAFGHGGGLFGGEGDAEPGIERGGDDAGIALDFELEKRAGAEETADFADVVFDDLARGYVVEDADGEGEIEEGGAWEDGEIDAVVVVDADVGFGGAGAAGEGYHFGADIDGVYFAEEARKRAGDTAGATPDFEDAHFGRGFVLADVFHVGEDLFGNGAMAAGVEVFFRPVAIRIDDVEFCVLAGAGIPIVSHPGG